LAVVAGVDFGALGSCVTLPDSAAYQLRMALSAYPLRGREELDRAIDHIYGVAKAAQTGVAETVFAARSTLCLPDKTSIPRLAADVGMKSTSPLTERCTLEHGRLLGNVPPAMLGIAASMRTTSHLEITTA
jgi:hypothetical protein